MATGDILLHLPDDLYRRLARLADLTHEPVEGLIVRTLSSNLPLLPEDLDPSTREALRRLEAASNDDLVALTHSSLSTADYERLTELRERRRAGPLTAVEEEAYNAFMSAADLLTLQKAYAAVLLKWRGQPLPQPNGASTPEA